MKHYIIREDRFRKFLNTLVGKKSAREVLRVVGDKIQVVDLRPGERALTPRDVQDMINKIADTVRA